MLRKFEHKHRFCVFFILALLGIVLVSGCIKQGVNQEHLRIDQRFGEEQSESRTSSELEFELKQDSGIRVADAGVPAIHKLENGRYRMYYHGPGGILSAISANGLNFEKESGIRISPGMPGSSESMVSDPTVITMPDGRIMMYYKGADRPGGPGKAVHKIFSATSSNGLEFEKGGLRIDSETTGDRGWASVPEAVRLPDGRVRIYYAVSYTHLTLPTN